MRFATVFLISKAIAGASAALGAETLAIAPLSDLVFGLATQGDGSKTIPPGTSENPGNASFRVTGEPHSAYTIVLPSSPATLTTGEGGANRSISISAFRSFPSEGANGSLDANGAQTLYVGATRDALLPNQAPGEYSGTFTITVVY